MGAWHRITVSLAVGVAFGCSGSGIPEERFCAEYGELECRTLAGWCGFTASACQTARERACQMRVQAQRTGARIYDQTAAAACFGALNRVYATQPIPVSSLREMQAACDRVYHGNNGDNQGCRGDADCERGLICRGRCVREAPAAAGEVCDQVRSRCPAGQYCGMVTGGSGPSTIRICAPAAALSQPCQATPCQEHLRCQDMVCVNRQPLEAECDRDLDCAPPAAYCNPYTGLCADRLSFAPGSVACQAQAGQSPASDAGLGDRSPTSDVAAGDLAPVVDAPVELPGPDAPVADAPEDSGND